LKLLDNEQKKRKRRELQTEGEGEKKTAYARSLGSSSTTIHLYELCLVDE